MVHKAHAALDNMMSVSDYALRSAVVYNTQCEIEEVGRITYLPIYALMFLKRNPLPERLIYKVDLSVLSPGV